MARNSLFSTKYDGQTGFTLVELALVLIIIGLLLGGTLKGQQVVESARVKRIALETVTLGDALRTYRTLYAAWPGDDPQAAQRWSGASPGNGNGVLEGAWLAEAPGAESRLLWSHLRFARLLVGEGGDHRLPQHPLGGRMGVGQGLLGLPGLAICLEALPSRLALGYDIQFDDGLWDRGRIRSSTPPTDEGSVWVCTQL